MNTTEIILRDDGTITERVISERKLKVQPAVLDSLTSDLTRELHHVFEIPEWGPAHASVGMNDTIWSVTIDRIPLNARFNLVNGVLVPKFASTADLPMPLVWRAPADVRLVFVTRTEGVENEVDQTGITGNWLFAYNQAGNGFRLPLPNLHDDCTICMGEFQKEYPSEFACVAASLQQFNQSKWNADLMRTVEQSQKFFRFKPTNETFETLPIAVADWTQLCDKVSTALMERVLP